MPPDAPETWDSLTWDSTTWDAVAENPNPPHPLPIQNVSAVFTATQLADLKEAILALNPLFPILVTLTEAERKRLQRVAAGRENFCEIANNGAEVFPTVVPTFMSKVEWDKDETYGEQLSELQILVAALLTKIHDTLAVVGAERYRQSRKFYEAVKAAREDVPGLHSLYEALREQFDGQGGDGSGGTPPPEDGGDAGGGNEGGNP